MGKDCHLVSHHLTRPSADAVISSLHVLLAVHTGCVRLERMIMLTVGFNDFHSDGSGHLLNRQGQYGNDQNQSQPAVPRLGMCFSFKKNPHSLENPSTCTRVPPNHLSTVTRASNKMLILWVVHLPLISSLREAPHLQNG